MSNASSSKTWIVAKKPESEITDDTFELQEKDLPELKDGEILVEVKYLCDLTFPVAASYRELGADHASHCLGPSS